MGRSPPGLITRLEQQYLERKIAQNRAIAGIEPSGPQEAEEENQQTASVGACRLSWPSSGSSRLRWKIWRSSSSIDLPLPGKRTPRLEVGVATEKRQSAEKPAKPEQG